MSHSEISALAYKIWCLRGHQVPVDPRQREEHALDNWFQAKRILASEYGRRANEGYVERGPWYAF